ncbi:MAG: HTH domain-containing protein [Candidatus Thermoplasmatota archaeon]|nr:HTH domain-containing protein [Candidatus Thermoplasmatota archaeon]
MAKTKGSLQTEKRRQRLKRAVATGITSPVQLARMLECSRRTIYNDLAAIKKEIVEKMSTPIEEVYTNLHISYQARNEEAWRILLNKDLPAQTQLNAINTIMRNEAQYIETCQSLGFLHKQPSEIRIEETPLEKLRQAIERRRALTVSDDGKKE